MYIENVMDHWRKNTIIRNKFNLIFAILWLPDLENKNKYNSAAYIIYP